VQNVVMLQLLSERPLVLVRLNEFLDDVARSAWKPITYPVHTSQGSGTVTGCMLLPPGYVAGRHYPTVIDVYPSRTGARCSGPPVSEDEVGASPTYFDYEHLLAAQGYVILRANTERRYATTPDGPISGMPAMAVQGADALIAAGYADPNRLGIIGMSQGGFSSLYVISQTNRFKAAVSANSWTDMYTHFYTVSYVQRFFSDDDPYIGEAERYLSAVGTDFSIGKTPQEALDVYVRNSPLFLADKIQTPVLLIHSDLDVFNVHQYEEMFTALYQQRKEAVFVDYLGEGHTPSSPANIRDAWARTLDWFDDHLDVKRDADGALLWNGNTVRGREGAL